MTTTIPKYRPRDVPVALKWAENDVRIGDFLAALDKFSKAEETLRHLPQDAWEGTGIDADERHKLLRNAQYGRVTTLLFLRRTTEAAIAAGEVIDEIFDHEGKITDQRFAPLMLLGGATCSAAFADVWGSLFDTPR